MSITNLTDKFAAFQLQSATQHTELMAALNTIAFALGAPPTTPTTTLADLALILTSINARMLTTVNQATAIATNTDTIINNNSLNTQKLLRVLLDTACPCTSDLPYLPLPIDVTPTELTDTAKCQRIQYFLDLFRIWVVEVGVKLGQQLDISSDQTNRILQNTLADAGVVGGQLNTGIPTQSLNQIAHYIAVSIDSRGGSLTGSGMFGLFADGSVALTLSQALYLTNNAGAAIAAFHTALNEMVLSEWIVALLDAMFYGAWANDMFGTVPVVDASAYDGSACAPPGEEYTCVTVSSTVIGQHNQITFPASGSPVWNTDPYGLRVRTTGAGEAAEGVIWLNHGVLQIIPVTNTVFDIVTHGDQFQINSYIPFGGQPFTAEICYHAI